MFPFVPLINVYLFPEIESSIYFICKLTMSKDKKDNRLPVAHFANEFALNGQIDFTSARQWILFLYLVGQIDPKNQGELTDAIVSLQDIERLLKGGDKKWGGLYEQIRDCSKKMIKSVCEFPTEIEIEGKKVPAIFNIFRSVSPFKSNGSVFLKYRFNDEMTPLLIGFKKNFMGIKPPIGIKSGHAIRFLILVKAERDRRRKYEKVTRLDYNIKDLKALLGIAGKYKAIKDFRKRVIEPIIEGVNSSGIVEIINHEGQRTGRSITHISFYVKDSEEYKLPKALQQELGQEIDHLPSKDKLSRLTRAQMKAYEFLVEKGIYGGIAYREIIPRMPSTVCEGYEDYFCEEAYKIVLEKSNINTPDGRAAIFVNWFKKDIFKTDQFSRIIEAVHQKKKMLSPDVRENREFAKTMTNEAFEQQYKKMETSKKEEK